MRTPAPFSPSETRSRLVFVFSIGTLATGLASLGLNSSCAIGDSSQVGSSSEAGADAPDPQAHLLAYRESNTTYWEIHADGEHVGYLLSYDALPEFSEVERHLPSGSHRIQDLGFSDLGFVTPTGEVRRYAAGGAESIGSHTLNEGLRLFYGEPQDIELIRLGDAISRDEETEEVS